MELVGHNVRRDRGHDARLEEEGVGKVLKRRGLSKSGLQSKVKLCRACRPSAVKNSSTHEQTALISCWGG